MATVSTNAPETNPILRPEFPTAAGRVRQKLTSRPASLVSIIIAVVWTIPTFGLLASSVRPEADIKSNGWWNIFTHPSFTLDNYKDVIFSTSSQSGRLATFFVNSVIITVPGVVFSVTLAAMGAYALSWLDFKGRDWIFIGVFALQIVPLQMALIPMLKLFSGGLTIGGFQVLPSMADIAATPGIGDYLSGGGFAEIWIAHTCFGLPLGIFLLHNFMSELPRDLFEAAKVDGAGSAKIFLRIVLPLITPALASLAIFQFLWIWNDLLVALVFTNSDTNPLTVRLAQMVGSRGSDWQRLTSGAFVAMLLPLIVFLSLQRYFVRGLLAGGVKG